MVHYLKQFLASYCTCIAFHDRSKEQFLTESEWELIKELMKFHPPASYEASKLKASISTTLRNWSSLEPSISHFRKTYFSRCLSRFAAVDCVGVKCKYWPSTSSAFAFVTYSFFASVEWCGREIVNIRASMLTKEENKEKTGFIESSDDGTTKKFYFNIHFICISFFSSERKSVFILALWENVSFFKSFNKKGAWKIS